jgi:hypothetical protein
MSGLKVRIDGQGNVDTAHLGKQLEQKAKDKVSNFIWGLVIGGIILFSIVALFVGIGVYAYFQAKNIGTSASGGTGAAPKAATWDGKAGYKCDGNENVMFDGVTAKLSSGAAISVDGNCHVTLKNCHITAPTGIEADGNGQVTVEGGDLTGTDTAIKAVGISKITVNGAKVTGKVTKDGLAKVTGVK